MSDKERYHAACHAMQSGVAVEINQFDNSSAQPKHLRTGINVALCGHAALIRLLIDKGIFTEEEYNKFIADEMEREVERYKDRLEGHLGQRPELL